jgi:hypothetical protein
MSLTVLAGAGSLLSIGVGAGDIATLFTLGVRFGNWLTALKGDADFLAMLEEDEVSILTRRGTIDMEHFKQRCGEAGRGLVEVYREHDVHRGRTGRVCRRLDGAGYL